MAIDIRVEDGLPIDVNQARTLLQSQTDSFGVFFDLDRLLEYRLNYMMESYRLADAISKYTGGKMRPSQREQLQNWFIDYFNIPDRLMLNAKGTVGFDKNIRANLLNANISEDAKEFLKLYAQWSASSYRVSYLEQYLSLPISYELSDKGHRMVIGNPNWVVLSTSRLAAELPSIQNIARDMKDIICAPEGWIYMRADSGQIEPRITYSHYILDTVLKDLIILYNDAYYGTLHYCLLDDSVFNNLEKYRVAKPGEKGNDSFVLYANEITDEMVSGRQNLKVLALSATYGSALSGQQTTLAKRYSDRIVNHPMRKEWEIKVRQEVNRGVEEFYSVFGSVIRPDETVKYKRGTEAWNGHVVRCGINNPIQTTASDLMICSLYEASKILSKAKYSHIAYYKHDEGAFYVHESEKYLISELAEITAYNVTENGRKWIPIHAEAEFGQVMPKDGTSVLDWG